MSLILNVFRGLTAIIIPLGTFFLIALSLTTINQDEGDLPQGEEKCIRCGQTRKGAKGKFQYTESKGNGQPGAGSMQLTPSDTPILGSESHFVCDHCARRNIRSEMIQIILMVTPYPLYLYVIIPSYANGGVFAGFLIETLLVVLSVAGVSAAFGLYRAVHTCETSLAEARDRVAISQRRNTFGKKFRFYTRLHSPQ